MACEFICDGCGACQKVGHFPGGWFKPSLWYERSDANGSQIACSRECIAMIAAKTGKTDIVAPF
jgi:hypothetical protein